MTKRPRHALRSLDHAALRATSGGVDLSMVDSQNLQSIADSLKIVSAAGVLYMVDNIRVKVVQIVKHHYRNKP